MTFAPGKDISHCAKCGDKVKSFCSSTEECDGLNRSLSIILDDHLPAQIDDGRSDTFEWKRNPHQIRTASFATTKLVQPRGIRSESSHAAGGGRRGNGADGG